MLGPIGIGGVPRRRTHGTPFFGCAIVWHSATLEPWRGLRRRSPSSAAWKRRRIRAYAVGARLLRNRPIGVREQQISGMSALDVHLVSLDAWLQTFAQCPRWAGHLLAENAWVDLDPHGVPTLRAPAPLQSAAAYADRFHELVTRGYPWVNLCAAGVIGGQLVVTVELPRYRSDRAGATSVNLSIRAVEERDGWALCFEPPVSPVRPDAPAP